MDRLKNKVAIVTGSALGIGPAIARRFAQEGARVIVTDIEDAAGEQVAAEIRRDGGEATYVHADLRAEAQVATLVAAAVDRYGGLTSLVNNAAVGPGTLGTDKPVIDIDNETLERALAVNYWGLIWSCKYALPHLLGAAGQGTITNISSVVTELGGPQFTAYSTTKAVMPTLTRGLARRHQSEGVRVNCVDVGAIYMERTAERLDDPDFAVRSKIQDRIPAMGFGTPDDVAWACVYLASDEARWITNATIPVNGGVTS